MNDEIYFTNGCILDEHTIVLSSVFDDMDIYTEYSEIIIWNDKDGKPNWHSHQIDDWVQSVIRFSSEKDNFSGVCAVAANGNIYFINGERIYSEKIDDVGNWGYLIGGKQIGKHLYVYGDNGQIYKRTEKNNWIHFDNGVLTGKNLHEELKDIIDNGPRKDESMADYIIRIGMEAAENKKETITLHGFNGDSENNLYVCGSINNHDGRKGILYHYNGNFWQQVDIPETDTIGPIFIFDNNNIFIGGLDGHFLLGNHIDGFKDISKPNDLMIISYIAGVNGSMYLGTSKGLFQYTMGRIAQPDIKSALNRDCPKIIKEDLLVDGHLDDLLMVGEKIVCRFSFRTGRAQEVFSLPSKGKRK